jgi:hypothetical protein
MGVKMMDEHLLSQQRVISVVGTGRGSGKTTTCNMILEKASKYHISTGVIPCGKGGSGIPAYLPAGALIAVARNCELVSKLELLEQTTANTPWGEVWIGRVRDACKIRVAGPLFLSDLVMVSRQMQHLGAELIVVDGTMARKAMISMNLCDSFILAVGVDSKGRSTRQEEIGHQLYTLRMPLAIYPQPPKTDPCAIFSGSGWRPFPHLTKIPKETWEKPAVVFIRGAVTEWHALYLDGVENAGQLILEEPWRMFLARERVQSLRSQGWSFAALQRSRCLGVTINPQAINGTLEELNTIQQEVSMVEEPVTVFPTP